MQTIMICGADVHLGTHSSELMFERYRKHEMRFIARSCVVSTGTDSSGNLSVAKDTEMRLSDRR
jgi:hypothetical protein